MHSATLTWTGSFLRPHLALGPSPWPRPRWRKPRKFGTVERNMEWRGAPRHEEGGALGTGSYTCSSCLPAPASTLDSWGCSRVWAWAWVWAWAAGTHDGLGRGGAERFAHISILRSPSHGRVHRAPGHTSKFYLKKKKKIYTIKALRKKRQENILKC